MELSYDSNAPQALIQNLHRVYLLRGSDPRMLLEAAEHLRTACIDETFADFDYEVVHAADTRGADLLSRAAQAPLASKRHLVVVRGAEQLRRKERAGDLEELVNGLAGLGPLSCLVLLVCDDTEGRNKTALSTRADAAIREHGCLVRVRALSRDELALWAQSQAHRIGKSLDSRAATRLVELALGDRLLLEMEMEKILCYVGDERRISLQAVEQVAVSNPQDVMFKLVDSVANRDAERAIRLFREALRFEPRPQAVAGKLIALLRMQMRQLWQALELREMGCNPNGLRALSPEIAKQLPAEHSILSVAWKARDLFSASGRWSRQELARAMEQLQECDLACKGGGGSEDVVTNVDRLLIRLCD